MVPSSAELPKLIVSSSAKNNWSRLQKTDVACALRFAGRRGLEALCFFIVLGLPLYAFDLESLPTNSAFGDEESISGAKFKHGKMGY